MAPLLFSSAAAAAVGAAWTQRKKGVRVRFAFVIDRRPRLSPRSFFPTRHRSVPGPPARASPYPGAARAFRRCRRRRRWAPVPGSLISTQGIITSASKSSPAEALSENAGAERTPYLPRTCRIHSRVAVRELLRNKKSPVVGHTTDRMHRPPGGRAAYAAPPVREDPSRLPDTLCAIHPKPS